MPEYSSVTGSPSGSVADALMFTRRFPFFAVLVTEALPVGLFGAVLVTVKPCEYRKTLPSLSVVLAVRI